MYNIHVIKNHFTFNLQRQREGIKQRTVSCYFAHYLSTPGKNNSENNKTTEKKEIKMNDKLNI